MPAITKVRTVKESEELKATGEGPYPKSFMVWVLGDSYKRPGTLIKRNQSQKITTSLMYYLTEKVL